MNNYACWPKYTFILICLNAALKGEQDDSSQFRSATSSPKRPRLTEE